jgi:hypothetical protein
MIAAARADQLVHVGVAALDTAGHDADRLAPQDRLAAVTGLTGGRGCPDSLSRDAQPQITAITWAKCRDGRRTGTTHDLRITRTAHRTHRQEEGVPGRYRGLEQRRRLSPDASNAGGKRKFQPSFDTAYSPGVKALLACRLAWLPGGSMMPNNCVDVRERHQPGLPDATARHNQPDHPRRMNRDGPNTEDRGHRMRTPFRL